MASMDGQPVPTNTHEAGPILKGGYMLHSPESRMAAAKMSLGYMVATAASIAQAASTALPPRWKIMAPAVAPSGFPVIAIQWLP